MIKKIKVLHVIPNLQTGGITRFVLDLATCQKEAGEVELSIFALSMDGGVWQHRFEAQGIELICGSIYRFHKIKAGFDIIHWHSFLPLLALSCIGDRKTHLITHHSVLGEGRIRKITYDLKWWLFGRFVNHKLDCEVYNSLYTKSFWQARGLKAKSNRLIYNGAIFAADPASITPAIERDGYFTIGTSSNFVAWKRVDLLIEAFAAWSRGRSGVRLLIVGDGAEMNHLASLTEELGVGHSVIFTGNRDNATKYQAAMDLCVFPSVSETFGLAALECLHLGKPVICMRDGGGICEVVGEESGNIVDDIDSLISKFDYYYIIPKKIYQKISAASKSRSLRFDMRDKAAEYTELYKELTR